MPSINRLVSVAALSVLGRSLMRMGPAARSGLARELMEDRHDHRTRMFAAFFERANLAWRNKRYEIHANGEEALLRRLAPFAPEVVMDVGANVGDWSLAAVQCLPGAQVHAFEISDDTAKQLRVNVAGCGGRVVVNACGLSDREGDAAIYALSGDSTATSTVRDATAANLAVRDGEHRISEMRARVTTGDAYMEERGIERVDVLKIDVEGAEPAVLRGFERAFADGRITLVQFEYGLGSLVTRFLLADFAHFFSERGYVTGKLLPDGVAFKPYEIADEDFVGPNYVACLETRRDIVEALRCAPLTVAW